MLTMIHQNPVLHRDGVMVVDRKFHTGMLVFASRLGVPLLTINPHLPAGAAIMDPIEVPITELPYKSLVLEIDPEGRPTVEATLRLRETISASRLVYGQTYGAAKIASELRIPYIALVEYDLPTRISISRSTASNAIKKAIRTLRTRLDYIKTERPALVHATAVHCNGYPMYDQVMTVRRDGLLYLDSRQTADMVISSEELARRLDRMRDRPLRLIYSGRFEPMKGALDAVRVGLACRAIRLDIEFDLFGQGSQKAEMIHLIQQANAADRIRVHDPVPFSELFERSKSYDIFVCCHVQADPSCTYLEAFGAGLPIVGYENAMWQRLNLESNGGISVPLGAVDEAAAAVKELSADPHRLAQVARNARAFALEHDFENEFAKRIDNLKVFYSPASALAEA
jgi:glycosyltransferase involved in cell wall biosynthesis